MKALTAAAVAALTASKPSEVAAFRWAFWTSGLQAAARR
jgi:hypothetical protein